MSTKRAIILTTDTDLKTDVTNVNLTRTLTKFLGFKTIEVLNMNFVTEASLTNADLIILTTSIDIQLIKKNLISSIMVLINKTTANLLVLGDMNSLVLEYLSYNSYKIKNHFLDDDGVHNIIDYSGNVIYIPSQHRTNIEVEYYEFVDDLDKLGKFETEFFTIIAISPERDFKKSSIADSREIPLEVEIFSIETINYLGIYGSPQLFFSDTRTFNESTIAETSLNYIKDLFTKVFNIKEIKELEEKK